MFYCEACARRNGWPDELWMPQSRGPCEVCGEVVPCFDVRSDLLPPVIPEVGAAVNEYYATREARA